MERLTERWSDSVVKLKGCSNVYANVERKRAHIQNAIVRLTAYEDSGLMLDEIGEEKRGTWLHLQQIDGHENGECSLCLKVRIIDNYCPNCGAKMGLEGEN